MLDRGFVPGLSLSSCDITRHAVQRYAFWFHKLYGMYPQGSLFDEVVALLARAAPCRSMSQLHREKREQRFGKPAKYFHAGEFRFVVLPQGELNIILTAEPDIHSGKKSVWEEVLRHLYCRRTRRKRRTHHGTHKHYR